MNKHPYHLHSICIHDGNALSGHYFTFIKDRFNNKWRRFNDIRVTDATEEDVFKESNGGYAYMTAYWVTYINDELARDLDKINLYSYNRESSHQVDQSHIYATKIPGEINLKVFEDNQKLK